MPHEFDVEFFSRSCILTPSSVGALLSPNSKTYFRPILLAGVAAFAMIGFALYILGDVIFGHGSRPGNILRVEFGALLFVLGLILLALCTLDWPQAKRES
jgi:hypothetical protein